MKARSCDTTTSTPVYAPRKSSTTSMVCRSRSLVGSSRMRKFGLASSTVAICKRRRSPPLRLPARCCCRDRENPTFSSTVSGLRLPHSPSFPPSGTASTNFVIYSRIFSFSGTIGGSCSRKPNFMVSPMSRVPVLSGKRPDSICNKVLLPAPLGPTTPMRSPGENSQLRSEKMGPREGSVSTEQSSRFITLEPIRVMDVPNSAFCVSLGLFAAMAFRL
mmetsp:Transcript_33632/g.56501  ORF Transcript_33632/g.56501 Transcript_33632/m.56501 type:complete len:218 (-) Transcript_33632:1138-1791(-)